MFQRNELAPISLFIENAIFKWGFRVAKFQIYVLGHLGYYPVADDNLFKKKQKCNTTEYSKKKKMTAMAQVAAMFKNEA